MNNANPTAPRATRKALLLERAALGARISVIDAELADLEDEGDGDEYSSEPSESLPPRTSRRAFAEWCRSGRVAGATKVGSIWSCSRKAWRDAHAPQIRNLSKSTNPRIALPTLDDDAVVEAALAGAGLRATRRAG